MGGDVVGVDVKELLWGADVNELWRRGWQRVPLLFHYVR